MRRMFELPEDDRRFLDGKLNLPWEAVELGGVRRLVIHDYAIPAGYNVTKASLYFMLVGGYPGSQIDMVYFHPALARADGRPINALSPDPFDGRTWQRWSRHRTAENPWIDGQDSIETQLVLVDDWLAREFR